MKQKSHSFKKSVEIGESSPVKVKFPFTKLLVFERLSLSDLNCWKAYRYSLLNAQNLASLDIDLDWYDSLSVNTLST